MSTASKDFTVTPDMETQAQEILSRYEQKRAATLPLLHLAQENFGYVTPEAESWVARLTGVSEMHVREVVSFYTLFSRKPLGRYKVSVCTTTSCVLSGAEDLLHYLEKKLGIRQGETTRDGKFTLEEVECLCACEMAPMMQINGKYYGPLTKEKVDQILDGLK